MKTFQEYLEMALDLKEVKTIKGMTKPKGSFDKLITDAQKNVKKTKEGKLTFKVEVDQDIFSKEEKMDLQDKYSKVYPGAKREFEDYKITSEQTQAIKDIFLQKAQDKLKTIKHGKGITITKFTGTLTKSSYQRSEKWHRVSYGVLHMEMK